VSQQNGKTVPKQSRGYLSLGFLSKAASLYHHAHAAGCSGEDED